MRRTLARKRSGSPLGRCSSSLSILSGEKRKKKDPGSRSVAAALRRSYGLAGP